MQMKEEVMSHNVIQKIPSVVIKVFSCLPVIQVNSLSACNSGGLLLDLDGHIPLCR